MKRLNWVVAMAAAMLLLACSNQKEPAEQAISKLDGALDAIHDVAAKYSPDTLQTVQNQVSSLKQSFSKGDYAAVLTGAAAVSSAIAGLKEDANTKSAAADSALAKVKQQWRDLGYEVPRLVAALHAQVDNAKGPPRGVSKNDFATVKDGVTALDAMWTDANNTVDTGDYAGAVTKGQAVKEKATDLMHTLGIKPS
jgi:hypothetical protein